MKNVKLRNYKFCNLHFAFCNVKGFTLIELIIAITIVSMIMAIILSGMRLSIRAWEVGEGRVEVYQVGRVILERMSQEIKSMHPYRYEKELPAEDKSEMVKKRVLAFRGESDRLGFTTIAESINPIFQGKGLREVFYYKEKDTDNERDKLLYRENIVFPHSVFDESAADKEGKEEGEDYKEASVITVSDQIAELKFKYYLVRREKTEDGKEEDVGEWVESFSGEDELREEEEAKAAEAEGSEKKKIGKPVLRAVEIKISMYETNPDGTINREKIISFSPLTVPIHIGREIKAI